MSWVVVAIVLFAAWLLFRAVGFVIRIVLWAVILFALYWLAAQFLPLPVIW